MTTSAYTSDHRIAVTQDIEDGIVHSEACINVRIWSSSEEAVTMIELSHHERDVKRNQDWCHFYTQGVDLPPEALAELNKLLENYTDGWLQGQEASCEP